MAVTSTQWICRGALKNSKWQGCRARYEVGVNVL